MLDRVKLSALHLLPKNAVSRVVGAAADIELPVPLRSVVHRGFAAYAGVNLDESARPLDSYPSLNAFFTRSLREGVHAVESQDANALVCPADGRLDQFGKIDGDTLIQAKGRTYRLEQLLDHREDAADFQGGSFATIYLSPKDYHRVHSPAGGRVESIRYIPGHLFPVNPFAVEHIDELFAVNERLITFLSSPAMRVAVVMVGATCVGRMSLSFSDLVTNQKFRLRADQECSDVELAHGAELGRFNLGSTVVLVVSGPFRFEDGLYTGMPIRMGTLLGHAHS